MAAAGNVGGESNLDLQATRATVEINGGPVANAYCLQVEDSTGACPGKAIIQIMGVDSDTFGNITLNATSQKWLFGARVVVKCDYDTIFLGSLIKRRDQGQPNTVILEAWSDMWLLSRIPVRGCFVWDSKDGVVKFIDRMPMRVNPNGYNNCIIAPWQGNTPVFAAYAEQGAAWDDKDYDTFWDPYKISAWTPKKLLQYMCAAANATTSTAGVNSTYRTLANSQRLEWGVDSVNFTSDQSMDLKLPDHSFQGQTMLRCVMEALEMSGDFGVRTNPSGGEKSSIEFFSNVKEYATDPIDLNLQRGGDVADPTTAYDFELDEDCSNTSESALGQGASIRIEGEFTNPGGILTQAEDNSTFKRSWDYDEEIAFNRIINGWDHSSLHKDGLVPPSPPEYCKYPKKIPDKTAGETWMGVEWILADGQQDRSLVYVNGAPSGSGGGGNSLSFARSILPRVWRAFEINGSESRTNGPLKGYNSEFLSTSDYPMLNNIPRPVMKEQLQYYIDQNKRRLNFPIRIQVNPGNGYHDVSAQSGLRIDSEGVIWLDGLTDENGAGSDRIYTGSLQTRPQSCILKPMKVNLAAYMDQRLTVEVRQSSGEIDGQLGTDLGGPLQVYIDSPEGYRLDEQVDSYPAAQESYVGTNINAPLTTKMRNDYDRLTTHVTRRGRLSKLIKRMSSWYLVGIQPNIRAGKFVHQISTSGQSGDSPYVLDAPAATVVWDFQGQRTICGGLIQQVANARGKVSDQYDAGGKKGQAIQSGGKGAAPYKPSQGPQQAQTADAGKPGYVPEGTPKAYKPDEPKPYSPTEQRQPEKPYAPEEGRTVAGHPVEGQPSQGSDKDSNSKRLQELDQRESDAALKYNAMDKGEADAMGRDKGIRTGSEMSQGPGEGAYAPKEQKPEGKGIKYQTDEQKAQARAESPEMDPMGANKEERLQRENEAGASKQQGQQQRKAEMPPTPLKKHEEE